MLAGILAGLCILTTQRQHTGMQIPPERIEELRRLYQEAHGPELSMEEAREMAIRLVMLYRVLKQPLPNETRPPSPELSGQNVP